MSRGFFITATFVPIAMGAAWFAGSAIADSMRCGKWIVNESVTKDELLQKCGEPQSRDVSQEEATARNAAGARVTTGMVTVTERWLYKPTPGALPMQVVIVDDKIVSLQRAE